jgi:hypothetical protein
MYTDPKSVGQLWQERLGEAADQRFANQVARQSGRRDVAITAARARIGGGLTRVGARIAGQVEA